MCYFPSQKSAVGFPTLVSDNYQYLDPGEAGESCQVKLPHSKPSDRRSNADKHDQDDGTQHGRTESPNAVVGPSVMQNETTSARDNPSRRSVHYVAWRSQPFVQIRHAGEVSRSSRYCQCEQPADNDSSDHQPERPRYYEHTTKSPYPPVDRRDSTPRRPDLPIKRARSTNLKPSQPFWRHPLHLVFDGHDESDSTTKGSGASTAPVANPIAVREIHPLDHYDETISLSAVQRSWSVPQWHPSTSDHIPSSMVPKASILVDKPFFGQDPLKTMLLGGSSSSPGIVSFIHDSISRFVDGRREICSGLAPEVTALTFAVLNRHVPLLTCLLEAGADVNQRDEVTGLSPLHCAVWGRSPDMTRILIESGAEVNVELDPALNKPENRWVSRILFALARCTESDLVSTVAHDRARGSDGGKRKYGQTTAVNARCRVLASTQIQVSNSESQRLNSSNDENSQPKRQKNDSSVHDARIGLVQALNQNYACPYVKFDPERYGDSKCGWAGYENISRLKEHLYKKHRVCEQCALNVPDGDPLQKHLENEGECIPKTQLQHELSDGFVGVKADKIRKRWKNEAHQQKWDRIYRILFDKCETDAIPSPYFETKAQVLRENERLRRENAALKFENDQLKQFAPASQASHPLPSSLWQELSEEQLQTSMSNFLSENLSSGRESTDGCILDEDFFNSNTNEEMIASGHAEAIFQVDDILTDPTSSSASGINFRGSSSGWLDSSATGHSGEIEQSIIETPSKAVGDSTWTRHLSNSDNAQKDLSDPVTASTNAFLGEETCDINDQEAISPGRI